MLSGRSRMVSTPHKSRAQVGCLSALVLFSGYIAFMTFPYHAWTFGAALGILAFASLFLRVGWFVPLTIAGFYFGLFVLDPPIKGGTAESQMRETITCILMGTIGGFIVGALIDKFNQPAA